MKLVPAHRAQVKGTNLSLSDPEKWRAWLAKLDGKVVRITVEEEKNKRSINQNRFYWLYLNLIEEETGNIASDMHEYFKRKFLPPRFVTVFGKEVKLPASTSKLDKGEFTIYMEKICAETGIPIPNPDTLYGI